MLDVISALIHTLAAGNGGELVTIIRSSGSSPQGTGAVMAVAASGRLAGTIGGGELEHRAEGQALAHLLEKRSQTASYDLQNADSGLGMVCGGEDELLYTYIAPTDISMRVLTLADACLQTGASGKLVLPFAGGLGFIDAQGKITGLDEKAASGLAGAAGIVESGGATYFVMELKKPVSVWIFGGGHVAQALCPLLIWLGFFCRIADDRAAYADPALFPGAGVCQVNYADLSALKIQPDDCIVIMTEGHKGDYKVEKWALTTKASYIGVIGSRQKTAYVNGLLEKDGFTSAEIARVHAPVGIPIGSHTPREIAVSIAAQLISHRAKGEQQIPSQDT